MMNGGGIGRTGSANIWEDEFRDHRGGKRELIVGGDGMGCLPAMFVAMVTAFFLPLWAMISDSR